MPVCCKCNEKSWPSSTTISTNQKTVLDFQQVCHFGIGCSRWSRFSVAHTFRQTVIQKCDLSKAKCFQLNYYLYCLPRQLLYFHPRQKMLVLLFFESDSCHNLKGSKTIKVCSFLSGECHYLNLLTVPSNFLCWKCDLLFHKIYSWWINILNW